MRYSIQANSESGWFTLQVVRNRETATQLLQMFSADHPNKVFRIFSIDENKPLIN